MLKITDLDKKELVLSSEGFLPSPWADPPPETPRSGIAQIAYAVHEANQIGKFKTNTQKAFSAHFEKNFQKVFPILLKIPLLPLIVAKFHFQFLKLMVTLYI